MFNFSNWVDYGNAQQEARRNKRDKYILFFLAGGFALLAIVNVLR